MSQSHELQLHITKLEEIRSILNSMKNLALIEVHKLARFQTLQSQAVAVIELAATDFLNFYPHLASSSDDAHSVCLLVGAERGFCGDFNESVISVSKDLAASEIIAIGSRLSNKLAEEKMNSVSINAFAGANVAEEVPIIVNRLIESISPDRPTGIRLTALYHDSNSNQISQRQLLPPFSQPTPKTTNYRYPPVLNLAPDVFFSELLSHYLVAVLHEILYLSLTAENHRRLQHLEGAVKHLDDETVTLKRKSQIYRQEEITEEIEVILINAENL
ncbi:MAG: F0F1 ATP synthase subunit gamma [Methylobacter sp.]|nr:F0F1 ATP synthase subunit gamma [Methylobacter sp.]